MAVSIRILFIKWMSTHYNIWDIIRIICIDILFSHLAAKEFHKREDRGSSSSLSFLLDNSLKSKTLLLNFSQKHFIWNIFGNQLSLFFRKEIIQNFVIGKVSQIENKTRKNILESMKMNFLYNFEQRIKIMRLMVQINFFVWRVFPNVYLCNLRQNVYQSILSTLVFNLLANIDMSYK